MRNVFLIGKAGVGKDEVARFMRERGYRQRALATPIKIICGDIAGRLVTKEDRALLIDFGQTCRRLFGEDVWCKHAWNEVVEFQQAEQLSRRPVMPFVISDGRHSVEYDYFVVQRGFVPVRIVAPDEVRFERLLKRDGVDQRAVLAGQETELDDVAVAFTIDNSGTLDDLERQVSEMLARINDD